MGSIDRLADIMDSSRWERVSKSFAWSQILTLASPSNQLMGRWQTFHW